MNHPVKPVAIIGGGITGLTAAFYLQKAGIPVTLFEGSDHVGGVIRSVRQNGYLAEWGPNTILETSPKISQLVSDAGLSERRLDPAPGSEARYLVRRKRPVEMPGSPLEFLTTPLFSLGAKLAVLKEPFVSPRRDSTEESIAEFVTRRLGREFLDHAIDAMVAGVYAGEPASLSVQQAFPKLAALEQTYGSLIKGQILGGRERRKRGEISKDRAPKFSFDEGLQVLPETLRARLGDAALLNTTVTALRQIPDGWSVESSRGGAVSTSEHSAVIHAGTAHGLAKLRLSLAGSSGDAGRILDLTPFSEIRHPAVASVVLGFRRKDVAFPCSGFGALIPRVEGFKILGTIFSSSLFPNRAPAGHLTLTSYIGGERHPDLALLSQDELFEITRRDLALLLGAKGKPTFQHAAHYPKAIPQYNIGYGLHRERMTDIERSAPGLFFAGHYRDGISLGDSIVSGCKIAERVEMYLKSMESSCA
jgi:oxygen-dependent protoporphyrinogen oxidase